MDPSTLSALIAHSYAHLFPVPTPRWRSQLDCASVFGLEMRLPAPTSKAVARTMPRTRMPVPQVRSAHRSTQAIEQVHRKGSPLRGRGGEAATSSLTTRRGNDNKSIGMRRVADDPDCVSMEMSFAEPKEHWDAPWKEWAGRLRGKRRTIAFDGGIVTV